MLTTGDEHEGFVGAGLKPALPNYPNPSCPEPVLSAVEGCSWWCNKQTERNTLSTQKPKEPKIMISQRGLNLLGFITLILVFVNIFLLVGNQSLQRIIGERQQVIMRSVQMQGPAREVVTALANLAVRTENEQLKSLLAKHGITVSVSRGSAADAPKGK